MPSPRNSSAWAPDRCMCRSFPASKASRSFKGHSFHTSRWDYDYTGGNPSGALMEKLADKRVGIIGTGATSVQCVPHLARACKELLCLSAHAVVRRCQGQRADRSGMVFADCDAGLAAALAGEFYRQPGRRLRGRRSGAGRLDRSVAAHPRKNHGPAARAAHPAEHAGGVRGFRFREDGGNPRPGRRRSSATARRPRS